MLCMFRGMVITMIEVTIKAVTAGLLNRFKAVRVHRVLHITEE